MNTGRDSQIPLRNLRLMYLTTSRFNGRRLFGGIGALVVKDDVSRYPEKAGLYVLTQTSEGGAALANRKNFRAKEFG